MAGVSLTYGTASPMGGGLAVAVTLVAIVVLGIFVDECSCGKMPRNIVIFLSPGRKSSSVWKTFVTSKSLCADCVLQGHTSCLDSDVEDDDDDLTADLFQNWQLSIGVNRHGCAHYRRRCKIRVPCCNEVFDCRHCHNDAKNINEKDDKKRHEIDCHSVEKVICSLCEHEQNVQQVCKNCGVCIGEFFCSKRKFFDDDCRPCDCSLIMGSIPVRTSKLQYHCDQCGICRTGGRDNFFQSDRCGCCYSLKLSEGHTCVEKSMHQDCTVCKEYLSDSLKDITVLPCGHTLHLLRRPFFRCVLVNDFF